MKNVLLLFIVFTFFSGMAQNPPAIEKENTKKENDSLYKKKLINYIGNGYFLPSILTLICATLSNTINTKGLEQG